LPVRQLQVWIERNVLLILKDAPFDRENPQLVPAAGSCLNCPKHTGHNKLLFAGISEDSDACSDPNCYAAKLEAHVQAKVAAKPELVQISTAYKQQPEGEMAIPRNKYVEIREEKPDTPEKAKWPEFKTCKYTTEAIVADAIDKGEMRKVCTEPTCPVHHPKKQASKADAPLSTTSREPGLQLCHLRFRHDSESKPHPLHSEHCFHSQSLTLSKPSTKVSCHARRHSRCPLGI
jgi:ParB family chromosome partitioning protein